MTDFSETYARDLLLGIARYAHDAGQAWSLCRLPLSIRDKYGMKAVVDYAVRIEADAVIGQFYETDEVGLFAQKGILAVCIDSDHHTAFTLAYDFFDFFVIDMGRDPFNTDIPDAILESRITEKEYKPVILKFPETLNGSTLDSVTDYCLLNGVDGIELRDMSQVERVRSYGNGKLPIIANCHIDSPVEAARAIELGASLVEIRTGLVREGPQVVSQMLQFLSENDSPEGDNSENYSSENEES